MSIQSIIAILLTITALASLINYRFFKLPSAIGGTFIALILSLGLMVFGHLSLPIHNLGLEIVGHIDFNQTFLGGMLSFLLFAGSLHINVSELAKQKYVIAILATIGVILSTFLTGIFIYWVTSLIDINLSFIDCLTFGALIAPTDPIAVLGALKTASAPKKLESKIAGEALFNDGIGIVLFVIMLNFYNDGNHLTHHSIAILFFQQLCGGILIGYLLGLVTTQLLRGVNNLQVSILITLALVTAGYLLASELGTSGPIAIVVAGLYVGTKLRQGLIAERTLNLLDGFWEMIDETLSTILFVLIGLEIINISINMSTAYLALAAIPIVLVSRYLSIYLPVACWGGYKDFKHKAMLVMTWGGLRGGVAIALALSLPDGPIKNDILAITYAIVVFSILVQGLTIKRLIQHCLK